MGQYLPEPSLDPLRAASVAFSQRTWPLLPHALRFAPRDRRWEPRGDESRGLRKDEGEGELECGGADALHTRRGAREHRSALLSLMPRAASHTALSARAPIVHQPTLDSEGAPGLPHPCRYSSTNRLESGCRRI